MASTMVCITGASGFLGSHVVEAFLAKSYTVVAAVRNPEDKKNAFLSTLRDKYAGNGSSLRVSAGDLNQPGSHDDAIRGCSVVVHVASVVKDNYDKDPFEEIINPAVEGTRDIIQSCKRFGVRRLIATSSIATVARPKKPSDPAYTEEDVNTNCSPTYGTYTYAKCEAEKVLQKEWEGEYVSIHPSLILGPILDSSARSSIQVILALCNGEFPGVPPMFFDWIDVRDAAKAHVLAAEQPSARGRYIISRNDPHFLVDFAQILAAKYPEYGITTRVMPWVVLWMVSKCDKRITKHFLNETCREMPGCSSARAEKELGFFFDHPDLRDVLIDTVEGLRSFDLVKKK